MGRQTSADFPLPIDVFADIAPAIASEDMESVREFGTHLPVSSNVYSGWINQLRDRVNELKYVRVATRGLVDSKDSFARLCTVLGASLGELVVQNADGARLIEVYDRGIGRIEDGVRYHQTRQGGDIHTDSVNHPIPFSYLLLACTAPATIGGESILVCAPDLMSALERFPDVIDTLREEYWFEGRGMDQSVGFFKAPILFDKAGEPHFRYLRGYIESAHRQCGVTLTTDQTEAFDVLDALLGCAHLQKRLALGAGDILITIDTQVFHGRTAFIDRGAPDGWASHRHMFRLWVEEPGAREPIHCTTFATV